MKTNSVRYLGSLLGLCSLLMAFSGCASSSNSTGTGNTTATLRELATDIGRGRTELDLAVTSLNDLIKNPQPDLRKQHTTFSNNVNTLGKTAAKVEKTTQELALKKDAFLQKWDAELAKINDDSLRKKGVKRQAKIVDEFKDISEQYEDVKKEFNPVMSKLRDIQTALAADLSANGLKTVSSIAEDVDDDAKDLGKSLDKLISKFKELGASLEPVVPPAKK
ncbi:MAG: DUF2959 family protein [Nibricoccus sp.]